MKFSLKLVLSIIVIMTCILSCNRFFIIRQSFRHSIEKSANQNSNQNIAQRYYIESNIVNNIQQGEEITNDKVIEYISSLYSYIGENSEKIALYDEKENIIFSNFEKTKDMNINSLLTEETNNYYIRKVEDKHYMLFSSYLTINNNVIYIINIYDITDLYEERDRQTKEILIVDFIILGIASIFIVISSKLLTRHINKLNIISKKIAKGEFSNRVSIKSKDEIGELANSFNIMSEEIENKINSLNLAIKQKNDFINGFTHEIKTPMTAIVGYSDMLRLRKCDEELTKKALNYIYNEAKRLEKLSYKLMDLMSLSENSIELETIDINNFIDKISSKITNLEDIIIKKSLETAKVKGDKELLEVVIRNLVENARKAEPKDGLILIHGEITGENKYTISVIDKGRGIPEEHIKRVIEDFYMVDKSRSRQNGGSGIGLSLCNKIVEIHGSKLNIESEENVGTKVYFDLIYINS